MPFGFGGGATKKKVEELNVQSDARDKEIEELEKELKSLRLEMKLCNEDTKTMQQQIESEAKDQSQADEENDRLRRTIEDAQDALAAFQRQIENARSEGDQLRDERRRLLQEEEESKLALERHREEVEAASAVAQEKAAILQAKRAEQEAERDRWLEARRTNDELKKQLAASQEQYEQARTQRDEARFAWNDAKEEVHVFRLDEHRLRTEHMETTQSLDRYVKKKDVFAKEIADLEIRHGDILAQQEELKLDQRNRVGTLKTVRDDFMNKQAALNTNLEDFEKVFQKVKAERHTMMNTNSSVRESRPNTLPNYFQLPTG